MKKILLVVSAALLSAGAFAQDIQWGVKAGLNMASVTDNSDAKMRPGLYAGAFAEYGISEFIGVQGELLYSMMGAKAKIAGVTNVLKNDYIALPILAKFYVLEGLSVDVGPQFGYMISAKSKISGSSVPGENGTHDYYSDVDKKFDISAAMGLSYKLCDHFDVSARYNLGLTKFDENSDSKNCVIAVGVGYRF